MSEVAHVTGLGSGCDGNGSRRGRVDCTVGQAVCAVGMVSFLVGGCAAFAVPQMHLLFLFTPERRRGEGNERYEVG